MKRSKGPGGDKGYMRHISSNTIEGKVSLGGGEFSWGYSKEGEKTQIKTRHLAHFKRLGGAGNKL